MAYFHGYPQAPQIAPPPVPAGRDCGCGRPRFLTTAPAAPGAAVPGWPAQLQPGTAPFQAGPAAFPPGPGLPAGHWRFRPEPGVHALISGGLVAPELQRQFRLPYRPGISIFQALAGTGLVQFGPNWRIDAAGGVPFGGGIGCALRLNGRQIPVTLLYFPLQPDDRVELELVSRIPEENGQTPYEPAFFAPYPSAR